MNPIEIRPCTVLDIEAAPNLEALLAEYAAESSNPEIGPVSAQIPVYRQLEAAGMLHAVGAFQDDTLAGFVFVLVSVLPHYGRKVATSESLFVAAVARSTGAGMRLLHEAEHLARKHGATAFLLSAPAESQLDKVMRGLHSYRLSNVVFIKELA